MRIVQIAPLEERVPPKTYGGTELVVYNLVEEMTRLGHDVFLLGTGDSKVSANLVPIVPLSLREAYPPSSDTAWRNYLKLYHLSTILKKIRELEPDVVHNHFGWRLLPFVSFIDCPVFTTMHGPLGSQYEQYGYENNRDANYVSISHNQRKAMPQLNWVETIYNGIDVKAFPLGKGKRDYFVFLGRTSPEKGLKEICQMIKGTSHRLKIAAKVDVVDQEYFDKEVSPFIDGKQIEFIGEVDHKGKTKLLSGAKALLLWLNWEEPFGLVVPEANVCGTPVIVNPRGSMPELVKPGVNGFLVNSLKEMKSRLDDVNKLDPKACRQIVEEQFSSSTMAKAYVQLAGRLTSN
jgi:glycosyltransferase involved in cell wall biosynthesis